MVCTALQMGTRGPLGQWRMSRRGARTGRENQRPLSVEYRYSELIGLDRLVMIATSFPRTRELVPRTPHPAASQREEHTMDSLTSGTFVGGGSFRCARCEYAVTLEGSDVLPVCPSCGNKEFVRASLFSTERIAAPAEVGAGVEDTMLMPAPALEASLAAAREQIEQPGEYLCYEDGGELRTVALTREWTRIGRSL